MILLPIILTTGLILFDINSRGLLQFGWGPDTAKFVRTLLGFGGSLLAGVLIGVIVSWSVKHKPEKALHRYLPLIIPTGYALIFAVLALLFAGKDFTSGWWGAFYFKNPLYILTVAGLTITGYPFLIPGFELLGYAGFGLGVLIQSRLAGFRKQVGKDHSVSDQSATGQAESEKTASERPGAEKSLRSWPAGFAVVLLLALFISYESARDPLREGIVAIRYGESMIANELTEYDLRNIAPFKADNGLARLDRPAALQFSDLKEMPRLDGATAAYPVYGAFVEAVYTGLGEHYRETVDQNSKEFYSAFVDSDVYPYNIIKCSKTSLAYQRLISKETDIIFVAEPSSSQLADVRRQGDEFVLTPIASEAFVLFTNIYNPVDSLTAQQIRQIYTGEITNWREVGGPSKSILAYQRPEDSGSQTIMQNEVMNGLTMMEPSSTTYASGMGDIIKRVAEYKNARNSLGYSFMYYSSAMIKNNQIKYLAVDGVKPTASTVKDRTYPYTVPVYAVTLKSNNSQENIQRLLQWILSSEGQKLIEQTGYIPLQP
jgi:phosphate transport system substrate-binding protein